MPTGLAQNTVKSAKSLAQQIARQVAREGNEVLKTAASQVTGTEKIQSGETSQAPQTQSEQGKLLEHQMELQDKIKSSRLMEAYQRELDDIHKQDLFKDLQAKISEGVAVPIEDYSQLTMDERQVLKAQMEAVEYQKRQAEYMEAQGGGSLFGSSKKGRKQGGGQKAEAEKQQQRVEKPVPPSG